jgi:hypothetical protein
MLHCLAADKSGILQRSQLLQDAGPAGPESVRELIR